MEDKSIKAGHNVSNRNPTKRKEYWNILIAAFTIISLIIILLTILYPFKDPQLLAIYIFDLLVTTFLAIDFYLRIRTTPHKLRYVIRHWYELPAMIPLALLGGLDAFAVTQNPVLSFKLIAFFRLARLFNLVHYIKCNEVFLLTGIAAVTIIFGAVGTYFAESGSKDANITSLDDAFWYTIETITTVAYGEFYPTTALGRVISSLLMFAAIGIVWTLGALVASNIIAKRIKEAQVGLLDETKIVIKNRIDQIEKLSVEELEILITMIRSLHNRNKADA
jgi:voltage-gated potassium channel